MQQYAHYVRGMGISIIALGTLSAQQSVSFIYSPGLGGSPAVVGRYCSECYYEPTDEMIYGKKGGDIFGDGTTVTPVLFDEIVVEPSEELLHNTIIPRIMRFYMNKFGITVEKQGNRADAGTIFNYSLNINAINIGQEHDIAVLERTYQQHVKKYPHTQVVLFGDSRGAATTFNFIALHQPQIAAAICEGIFDSMCHVMCHIQNWHSKGEWLEAMLEKGLVLLLDTYEKGGVCPLAVIDKLPRDLPLLLVVSEKDENVAVLCTLALYKTLLKNGYTTVHILILKDSEHDSYMIGSERERYESCVHAFYRHYGIPAYDEQKAAYGEAIFAETQPTLEVLERIYASDKKCCIDPQGLLG